MEELSKVSSSAPPALIRGARLDQLVRHYLVSAVGACGGNMSRASILLGINRRTLQRKLSRRKVPRRVAKPRKTGGARKRGAKKRA